MIIPFQQQFALPIGELYSYFATPADWIRLYGLAGMVKHRGDGWYTIPLKRFPFPLVAKITTREPNRLVRWMFRGFWRGEGEIRFSEVQGGVVVTGYESIAFRWLFVASPLLETLVLGGPFRRIWAFGWRRLREQEAEQRGLDEDRREHRIPRA